MFLVGLDDIAKRFLDVKSGISSEVISSFIVIGIIIVLSLFINVLARKQDPLKKPKGLLLIAEIGVDFFDNLTISLMGKAFKGYGGLFMALGCYLFLAFVFGLTGLPSPVTNLAVPLSLGLVTFTLIHATSVKYTKWKYFKRYVDPAPIMLPINLISMWAPLLSLTFRLFGNALAGWTLMTLVYSALRGLSITIFSNPWISATFTPFVTTLLHCYFDLFSAVIQTVVFLFLSMIFVSNEGPSEDEEILELKGGK